MRTEKRKRTDVHGIEKENTRTASNYNNNVMIGMNIFNITLINSNDWLQSIDNEIKRAGAKVRSNSVVALDTIYTATPDFFKESDRLDYFKDCLKFHERRYGHVISAIIHYDETTPHLHIISVPLTKNDNRLSARDIVGNKAKMSHVQDLFYKQVGKAYGLERGKYRDGQDLEKHISAQQYRAETIRKEAICAEKKVQLLQKQISDLQESRRIQHEGLMKLCDEKNKTVKNLNALSNFITTAEKRQIFHKMMNVDERIHELAR